MLTTFEDDTKFRGEWLVYLRTGPITRETEEFTGRNLMKFNKCKVLHFGQKNPCQRYRLENNWQHCCTTEKKHAGPGGQQAKYEQAEHSRNNEAYRHSTLDEQKPS